jgi:hypothetical protein
MATHYELVALEEARRPMTPYRTPVSALAHVLRAFADGREEAPPRSPERDAIVAVLLDRGTDALVRLVLRTLDRERVMAAFRRAHAPVASFEDIRKLELWEVDELTRGIKGRYVIAAAALGALSSLTGRLAPALNAAVLAGLAARGSAEVALFYGLPLDDADDRRRALDAALLSMLPSERPTRQAASEASETGEDARPTGAATGAPTGAEMVRIVERVAAPVGIALRAGGLLAGLPALLEGGRPARRSRRAASGWPSLGRLAVGVARAASHAIFSGWLLHGVIEAAQVASRAAFLDRARAAADDAHRSDAGDDEGVQAQHDAAGPRRTPREPGFDHAA